MGEQIAVWIIGWTLLNSLWLGIIAWMIHRLLQLLLRRSKSQTRYIAACSSLVLYGIAIAVTVAIFWPSQIPEAWIKDSPVLRPDGYFDLPVVTNRSWFITLMQLASPWLPLLTILWTIGMVIRLILIAGGWYHLSAQLKAARLLPMDTVPQWSSIFQHILPGINVRLLESAAILSPACAGWWRPVIIMPAWITSGQSYAYLDCVLAHELAHIRRRDYLVNLLQSLMEALFFYHPFVWWLSNDIRQLREDCCDDIATHAIGDTRKYATALSELDKLRPSPTLALGIGDGSLVSRIRRLVEMRKKPPRTNAPKLAGSLLGAAIMLCVLSIAAANMSREAREQMLVQNHLLGKLIYESMNVPPDNNQLVPALAEAVGRTGRNRPEDPTQLSGVVDAILNGSDYDTLFNAQLPYLSLDPNQRLANMPDCPFGGHRQWYNNSTVMWKHAKTLTDPIQQRRWARAALLLGSQRAISPPMGHLQYILTDPAAASLLGISEDQASRFRHYLAYTIKQFDQLSDHSGTGDWIPTRFDPSRSFEEIARFPFFQWQFVTRAQFQTGQDRWDLIHKLQRRKQDRLSLHLADLLANQSPPTTRPTLDYSSRTSVVPLQAPTLDKVMSSGGGSGTISSTD